MMIKWKNSTCSPLGPRGPLNPLLSNNGGPTYPISPLIPFSPRSPFCPLKNFNFFFKKVFKNIYTFFYAFPSNPLSPGSPPKLNMSAFSIKHM